MTFESKHDAGDIVILTATGNYTTDEFRSAVSTAVAAAPAPVGGLIIDLTGSAALAARTAEDVSAMAAYLADLAPSYGGRLIMVAQGPLGYGLMRMGTSIADSHGVQAEVTTTLADARARLELSDHSLPGDTT